MAPHKDKNARRAYLRKRYADRPDVRAKSKSDLLKWRRANKPKVSAQNRRAYRAHTARDRARNRAWYVANRENLRIKNGLPEPTRPRPDRCELCGNTNGRKVLALDHCHVTGEFRGWLCSKCNASIGALGDCAAGLRRAVAYLVRAGDES